MSKEFKIIQPNKKASIKPFLKLHLTAKFKYIINNMKKLITPLTVTAITFNSSAKPKPRRIQSPDYKQNLKTEY